MAHFVEKADAKVHQIADKVEGTLGTGPHLNRGHHHVGGRTPYVASGAGGFHHIGGPAGGYRHNMGGRAPYPDGAGSYVAGAGPHMGGVHVPALAGHHHRHRHYHHGRRHAVGAGPNFHRHMGGPVAYGGGAGPHFGGRSAGFHVGGVHMMTPGGRHRQHHHVGGRPVNRIMHPVRGGGMHHFAGSY